jgi:hypothetical protein
VDAPLLSVDSLDLAFSALEGASDNLHGVALADGDGSDVVLGLEVLAQMAAHDLSSEVGGSGEVGLSGLSSLAGHSYNTTTTWSLKSRYICDLTGVSLHLIY